MADDELRWIEAAMGAVSKIDSDDDGEMVGSRCPKCNGSRFVKTSDLYVDAVGRLEESPDSAQTVREGGITDLQIVERFAPPRRKSVVVVLIVVAIPLAAITGYVYTRFGSLAAQMVGIACGVVLVGVFLTRLRRYGDDYYHARREWRGLFMCRQCGQLVRPAR